VNCFTSPRRSTSKRSPTLSISRELRYLEKHLQLSRFLILSRPSSIVLNFPLNAASSAWSTSTGSSRSLRCPYSRLTGAHWCSAHSSLPRRCGTTGTFPMRTSPLFTLSLSRKRSIDWKRSSWSSSSITSRLSPNCMPSTTSSCALSSKTTRKSFPLSPLTSATPKS